MARFRAGAVRRNTEAVLAALGVRYHTFAGTKQCCGSVLMHTGLTDAFKRLAQANTRRINAGP